MVESGRVPGKVRIRASIEKMSGRVMKKGRNSVSIEKWYIPCEYWQKEESMRISKNCPGEFRKRVESVRVAKNGRIRASTGIR